MNVFYAMNLGMLVDLIGDSGLKILVIKRFELTLNEFHFRWLKIQHYRDKDESSNSYFDSVMLNHLK